MSRMMLVLAGMTLAVAMMMAEAQNTGPRPSDAPAPATPDALYVDPRRGDDVNPGSQGRPVKTVAAAVALLPDPLTRKVTIRLAEGRHATSGGAAPGVLDLSLHMRPGVMVAFASPEGASREATTLAWEGGPAMIRAAEGHWRFENLTIGSGSTRQRRGVEATGPAHVELAGVTFRTRSQSDAGIYAHRGGKVSLYGAIRMNEHLHERAADETFCGIIADDHGLVKFEQREGASLDIGNGSLSASYYGCIRLGCARARITSWADQSNTLAINNGGRIDLHGSTVALQARKKGNTPVGLEHDGHVLGEGAHLIIEGENGMAIALQKASTFTCNDIELRGRFDHAVWASSGSMFVGRFMTDVGRVEATTGAGIHIEDIRGKLIGPAVARHCGNISLPDRDVWPGSGGR